MTNMFNNTAPSTSLRVFYYMTQYHAEHGFSPTQAEIGKDLGVSGTTVRKHLKRLARIGAVNQTHYVSRGTTIIQDNQQFTLPVCEWEGEEVYWGRIYDAKKIPKSMLPEHSRAILVHTPTTYTDVLAFEKDILVIDSFPSDLLGMFVTWHSEFGKLLEMIRQDKSPVGDILVGKVVSIIRQFS